LNSSNETITEEEAADIDHLYVHKDKYRRLKSKFNGLKEEYLKVLGSWEHTNGEVRKLNAERR